MSAADLVPSSLPGEPAFPRDLPARLQAALADKGTGYEPRTHHLQPGGAPTYTNRLILEGSPYLLQHAHNPVNWYAWGDEAFEDARRLGRPVFLSIGYSTCHWCHVMEGESFEDEEIAAYLNQHYIPVKVDREERPDIDAIYMSAVQALTGQGGWPMSVWLTAERTPFFAGTYFPPRDGVRGSRFGFLTMLREIRRTFDQDPERVKQATASLVEAVKQQMSGGTGLESTTPMGGFTPTARPIQLAVETYGRIFDPTHGGMRRAPKFPSNLPVRLMLRHHRRTGDAQLLHMASFTLEKMAAGGMYDQIGGGFHRYSTDERWLVPHFEKMLYDNALLGLAYAEAWQVTRRADFARVLRETLDYVLREMTAPEGGFYSATDADSEGEEGKFFVWSAAEVKEILGQAPDPLGPEEIEAFLRHHDITAAGNFEGANIPNVPRPSSDDREHARFAAARRKLYDVRARRVPPLRDDKILAAWNGLMISAMAVAGRTLGEPRYVEAAARAADFVLTRMRAPTGAGADSPDVRVRRAFKDGKLSAQGFLEDQSFVVQGLLDLFESRSEARWLREALAIADAQEKFFADQAAGGWFMTANDAEVLIAREKPTYDGAEPSGTSIALLNALRLHTFTTDDRWRQVAEQAFASIGLLLDRQPLGLSEALLALDYRLDVPRELAVVLPAASGAAGKGGGEGTGDAEALLEVVRTSFVPNKALAIGAPDGELASLIPWLQGKEPIAGQATAYVCEHGRCELPTAAPETLRQQLAHARPYPT